MRLIDADAVIPKGTKVTDDVIAVHNALAKAPTIEAEPVKYGRWLPQTLLGQRVWDCSECATLGSPHWKRCPVCEAKMDGGEV